MPGPPTPTFGPSRPGRVLGVGVGPGLSPRDRLVDAEVVGRRLEWDPSVVREVDLDPRVRVLEAHDVAFSLRIEGAGSEADDQACRDAERAEHVTHRGREELAV